MIARRVPKAPRRWRQAVGESSRGVSGTAPVDSATRAIGGTTIQEQTRRCLVNIRAILEEAGSSSDKVVRATVVLAEEEDFSGMNEEWLKWFPDDPPARL